MQMIMHYYVAFAVTAYHYQHTLYTVPEPCRNDSNIRSAEGTTCSAGAQVHAVLVSHSKILDILPITYSWYVAPRICTV